MLEANIISRSRSNWSAPCILVDKGDKTKRFCIDYRKINRVIKNNVQISLTLIDDILTVLGNAQYFSTLDLKSGYWQIGLDKEDKCKTAFICHKGLYEFNVLPFGLSIAPSIFMELMNKVLDGCESYAMAYLDDIIIFSPSLDTHLKHIEDVMCRLRTHNLRLKLNKCTFLLAEINYLGYVISPKGIKPDSDKVEIIKQLSAPKTVKETRSFLGTCGFYRRFIKNYAQVALPLTELTKKHARFHWDSSCQLAFETLKQQLETRPLIVFPDLRLKYVLHTDASQESVGAVLSQAVDGSDNHDSSNLKPIHFLSYKFSKTQRKWPVIVKECFAIYYALQKLDHYLHGAKIVIYCDHKPLQYLMESPNQNKQIQLWALTFSLSPSLCYKDHVFSSIQPHIFLSKF